MKSPKVTLKKDVEKMTRTNRRSGIPRRDFLKNSLCVLAGPYFLSCSNSPTEPEVDPRLTARPGAPTITPTTGLTQLGLGQPRDGFLYVPTSYDPDTPAPLLILLHGAGGKSDNWTSFQAHAEERGMILLAIDSRARTWDLTIRDFGPDVEFLDRALQHTFDRCRIDPSRLALAGFSDGASYTLSLGIANGDLFSNLIGFSPGFLHHPDPIVGKPPIFIAHGNRDTVLPINTTGFVIIPSLLDDGYDVTFFEFNGGHQVPASASEAALDWFLDTA